MNEMNDDSTRRLRDLLQHIEPDRIPVVLEARGSELVEFAQRGLTTEPRSELSFALQALVARVGHELIRLAERPMDVEEAARAVRNVFETNLIVRYVSASRDNVIHWITLRVKEEAEILRASLALEGGNTDPITEPIRERIAELERYLEYRKTPMPRPLPKWRTLAESYNLTTDYLALYGVFSKYVHPSAWTIVKPDTSWNPLFAQLFLIHAQMYAFDAAQRAAEALNVSTKPLESGSWSESAV